MPGMFCTPTVTVDGNTPPICGTCMTGATGVTCTGATAGVATGYEYTEFTATAPLGGMATWVTGIAVGIAD